MTKQGEIERLLSLLETQLEAVSDPHLGVSARLCQLAAQVGGGSPPEVDPWAQRMASSAQSLVMASAALDQAVTTPASWVALSGPGSDPSATQTYRHFRQQWLRALTGLIDLYQFDQPGQPFPDLSAGFTFRCANVTIDMHTELLNNASEGSRK